MPIEVILPKVDMDMSSGTIADWHKSEGESVEEGEALFDIETDKATMEVESPGTGTLYFVSAKQGDEVPIGKAVAWIFADSEEIIAPDGAALIEAGGDTADLAYEEPASIEPRAEAIAKAVTNGTRATPLARRVAKELGIDLTSIAGSGPKGRITRADVEAVPQSLDIPNTASKVTDVDVKTGAEKTARELGLSYSTVPVTKMRSVIAKRLTESKSSIPHFYLNADVELDALLTMRAQMNAALEGSGSKKISVNDFLIKACASALRTVPDANAAWDGDTIVKYDGAHISVAVSIDGGLVTPVIRNAQAKGIQTISTEIADLADRAKHNKLSSKECQGGSFSLSNLGMFGVASFNAIINPPESMILAVGQGAKRFIPDAHDQPKLATIMSVSLSCDHRVVDGALGATWLKTFKMFVENPAAMMLN